MSLPIFAGFPHSSTVLRDTGIERILDYDPVNMPVPDLTYATEFIDNNCGGIYLKWLDRWGTYRYYLYSEVVVNRLNTKSLKTINANFKNRINSFSRVHEIGKEANRTLDIFTRIPKEYVNIVEGVLYSPEVYLYTDNMPLDLEITRCGWIKVQVKSGNFTIINSSFNSEDSRLKIELPELYTQALI